MLALARHPLVDDYDLSSLRGITCAAAPLGPELAIEVADRIGCAVSQAFGMTELSPMSHSTILPDVKPGSSGVTVPNTESLIVDDEGRALGLDEVGQLLVRGPQVMAGISEQPRRHRRDRRRRRLAAHRRSRPHRRRRAPVHHRAGQRADQVQRLPGRTGRARSGAPRPPRRGRRRRDRRARRPSRRDPDGVRRHPARHRLTSQDLIDHVAGKVATYKRVRRVEFVDEIPKSAAGKILRRQLHATAVDLAADEPPTR
jgi:acyl-coenzyme A synthetase/AMP-(fatty) acid ligase